MYPTCKPIAEDGRPKARRLRQTMPLAFGAAGWAEVLTGSIYPGLAAIERSGVVAVRCDNWPRDPRNDSVAPEGYDSDQQGVSQCH